MADKPASVSEASAKHLIGPGVSLVPLESVRHSDSYAVQGLEQSLVGAGEYVGPKVVGLGVGGKETDGDGVLGAGDGLLVQFE